MHECVDELINSHVDSIHTQSVKFDEAIHKEEEKLCEEKSEIDKMFETFEKTTMAGLDLKLYCRYLYTSPCMINHIMGLKQL